MAAPASGWERRADALLGIAASAILLAMMMLTFADVLARYVFNRPIRGAFELTELALLVLIFAGLPLVSRADEHVTMEFVDRVLAPARLRLLQRAIHLLVAALMFFMAWQVWLRAGRVAAYGDATDVLRIAYGPFVYFMAAMVAAAGVIHLLRAWRG